MKVFMNLPGFFPYFDKSVNKALSMFPSVDQFFDAMYIAKTAMAAKKSEHPKCAKLEGVRSVSGSDLSGAGYIRNTIAAARNKRPPTVRTFPSIFMVTTFPGFPQQKGGRSVFTRRLELTEDLFAPSGQKSSFCFDGLFPIYSKASSVSSLPLGVLLKNPILRR